MAASTKITADFTSDTSGMQKGIARITGMFNKLTKTSTKTQKALSRMTSGINFLVFDKLAQYALAAGRAFKSMVSGSINAIDAVDKLSKSTGISTEGLQVFGLAAQKAGVDQVKLSGAFGRMSKRLAEASQGFGEALPALQRLGISIEDLQNLSPEEQFMLIGQAIGGLATEGEQAAAAFKIFSDQGLALVPLFTDMAEQTEAAREELEKFGGILSDQQIAGTVALKDNLTDVKQIFSNIINQVTANLAPAINAVVDSFKEFVSSAGGANIGKSISDGILDALAVAGDFVDQVVVAFSGVGELFGVTGTLWENVAFALDVAFKFGWKVGKFLQGIFHTFESIGAGFVAGLLDAVIRQGKVVEALLRVKVPGLDELEDLSDTYTASATRAFEDATASFSDAFSADLSEAAATVDNGFGDWFRKFKEAQSEIAIQDTPTVNLSEESKNALTAQNKISGLDARSSAGMNFLLQSGVSGNVEDKQLAIQKKIEKNTARPRFEILQMGLP